MLLDLYVATTNPGKLRDFAAAADAASAGDRGDGPTLRIAALPAIDGIPAPPEDSDTFEGNARSKAIYYSLRAPGKIVLADDSGLEVDALAGAPGVRSARYAADASLPCSQPGDISTDECNNRLLIQNLLGVSPARRTARYRCVIVAARDGRSLAAGAGSVEGAILDAPRGTGGFGYDPLFYLPELQQTMAEIGLEQKNQISHRGMALRRLLALLRISAQF
jgi:XTP/dITP diphosphohydrolase